MRYKKIKIVIEKKKENGILHLCTGSVSVNLKLAIVIICDVK